MCVFVCGAIRRKRFLILSRAYNGFPLYFRCVCGYFYSIFSVLRSLYCSFSHQFYLWLVRSTNWMRKNCTSSLNKITKRMDFHEGDILIHPHMYPSTVHTTHKHTITCEFQWQINFQAATIFIVKVFHWLNCCCVVAIHSVILFLLAQQQQLVKKKRTIAIANARA